MKNHSKKFSALFLIFSWCSLLIYQESQAYDQDRWFSLEPGLDLGIFNSPEKSEFGDSKIRLLRIDPNNFEFKLLNSSSSKNGQHGSAKYWVTQNNLVAAINASMYQRDQKTSVSYMQTQSHVNNQWVSKDKAFLVFDPKDKSLPPVQIVDRECDDFPGLRKKYGTIIQSIRMISCDRKNVWTQQSKKWSTAAIGMDAQKNILFIHVRSPYSTHDLINILLDLPVDLERIMYVEGGAEAQMYIKSEKAQYEFIGSYSTGSNENDDNFFAWPIPNVIGIFRAATVQK